jgi:hypothetical protein
MPPKAQPKKRSPACTKPKIREIPATDFQSILLRVTLEQAVTAKQSAQRDIAKIKSGKISVMSRA